ncbi:unnamed protein product [Urochloa decumbens]|uniref:Uncharacterized protein n=1 Tax=Urochloa decumbens TaxID=240449 RepID=A0ABC9GZV8_9POAL
MATCKSLLMVPVTLFFFLLMLPAQSKENSAVVIFWGTARCKSNPSKIINNATLHVTINGTTLATSKTTSTGKFLMVAKVTTKDQLSALVSKKPVITAPRQACGVPAAATAARKLAALADLNGHRILADNSEEDAPIYLDSVDGIIEMLINDPNVGDVGDDAIINIDQMPEYPALQNFLEDSGLDPSVLIDMINDFLGMPTIGRNA